MGLEAVQLVRTSPVPLFFQLSEQIRTLVEGGQLKPGTFLPGEHDLAALWGVSRPTIRRALDELATAGLVQRRRGLGTMVARHPIRRSSSLSSLFDDLVRLGHQPTTQVLSMSRIRASEELAHEMQIRRGADLISLRRVRLIDGSGLALMQNFIPADVLPLATRGDFEVHGLYALMRERGIFPTTAMQLIGARIAQRHEASHLSISEGSPVLTAHRTTRDQDGRIVDLGKHVYDASHYLFEMNMTADKGIS